ncbi:MAG: hypothetical protein PGN25_04165 [Methylorubrum populi]
MSTALISDRTLGQVLALASSDQDRTLAHLLEWWNLSRESRGASADHLAIYIAKAGGSWRNALRDDPTSYRIAWLEAGRSCVRWQDVIFEFRTLLTVDGRSRSYPAAAPDEHYLLIEPCDAYEWSCSALREAVRHLGLPMAG